MRGWGWKELSITFERRLNLVASFKNLFSPSFTEHTSLIFKSLKIVKFFDIVKLITSVFMYKFHRKLLPSIFSNFFTPVRNVHNYNTRLASKSSLVLPSARTNYRIISLKFQGPKTWNSIDESLKSCSISAFKKKLKNLFISQY